MASLAISWLTQNADVIGALASVGMFFVWLGYANLFYHGYMRQRRPLVIIDQMSGPGTEATCVVANLSEDWIYIECVFAVAHTDDGELIAPVTDGHAGVSSSQQNQREIVSRMRQGPLASGGLIAVGTVRDIAERAITDKAGQSQTTLEALKTIEIRVVVRLAASLQPVGAFKRINVDFGDGSAEAWPADARSQHLTKRRHRKQVQAWLEQNRNRA